MLYAVDTRILISYDFVEGLMRFNLLVRQFRLSIRVSTTLIFWLLIARFGGLNQLRHIHQDVTPNQLGTANVMSPTVVYTSAI